MAIKFLNDVNTEYDQPLYSLTNTENKDWTSGDSIGKIDFRVKDFDVAGGEGLVFAFNEYSENSEKIVSFIEAISDSDSQTPSAALTFGTSSVYGGSFEAMEHMRLTSDGKLGLGNSLPTTKLDVSGGLKVSEAVTLSNYANGLLQVNANGLVSVDASSYLTSVSFGDLTSTPTTVAGYGITDADNYIEWHIAGEADSTDVTRGKWVKFVGGATINGTGTEADPYLMDLSSLDTNTLDGITDVGSTTTNSITVGGINVTGDISISGTSVFNKSSNILTIGDIADTDSIGKINISSANDSTLVTLDDNGNVGINTATPDSSIDITGTVMQQLRLRTAGGPTSNSDANGREGDFAYDDMYLYVKTGSGWGRLALDFVF